MSFHNHGLNGEYKGYKLDDLPQEFWLKIFPKRTKYHITMDANFPMYFIDHLGRMLTPRKSYESDFASIPPPFDRIWSPSEFRRSGMLHDDCCRNQGLWQIMEDGKQKFLPMCRLEADQLIAEMACCEVKLLGKGRFYQWITRYGIFWGVRLGSYMGIGRPNKKPPNSRIDPLGMNNILTQVFPGFLVFLLK